MTPAISVVMPLYNTERHLSAALDSVLAQTFTDFEVIAVDDGSKDGTFDILQRYAARDSRVRVLSRPNTGIVGALNDGLALARGDFVARMDGDDLCLPDRFNKQARYLREHAECVLVGSQVLLIDPDGEPICPHKLTRLTHEEIDHDHLNRGWPVVHPAVMMRKAAVEKIGGYREQYKWLEDLDLFLRMAEVGKLANLPDTLLKYRLHFQSVCHTRWDIQIPLKQKLYEETRQRRGIPSPAAGAALPVERSEADEHRLWAWWALKAGNIATARKHALKTFRRAPLSMASWRIVACAVRGHQLMKSVLYIGAGAPWFGGAGFLVRQRMFLRALSEVAELHLALFDAPADALASRPDFARHLTPLPGPQRIQQRGWMRLIADLTSALPRTFRTSRSDAARELVTKLQPSAFDAVFAFRIDFAHFAGVLGHPRLLLDIDDPEHLRLRRRLAATCGGNVDWRTRHDLGKLECFEKRAVRGALASFVCQEHDRAGFEPLPIVVPNCVDVPPACPPRRASRPRIVFLGSFAAGSANVDGLNWFLDEIWPRIRTDVPEAKFHVIGRLSREVETRLAAIPGAMAAGFVDDLGTAMAEASLSIAPIRFGTGTRVKIIESFALGCPVVSTTLGAEGIEITPGKEILIGDTPADFARRCVTLLCDRAAQARVAGAGYDVAYSRYNEEGRRQELVNTLAELLDQCAKGAGGTGAAGKNSGPAANKIAAL